MSEDISVRSSRVRDNIYVEFWLNAETPCVSELSQYNNMLVEEIQDQFKDLIKKHDLDFASDSCFIVENSDKQNLVICLIGEDTEELCRDLEKMGFPVEEV